MTNPTTNPAHSLRSQALDAVVAALGGAAQNAFRCRVAAFTAAQLPADNVLPESETTAYDDNLSIDRRFRFHVRHTCAAADGVDVVADGRYVRANRLLLADPRLGGLVTYLRELGSRWEFESRELDTVALVVTYEAELSTSRTDPAVGL